LPIVGRRGQLSLDDAYCLAPTKVPFDPVAALQPFRHLEILLRFDAGHVVMIGQAV
jgi:hypothetical protein